MTLKISRFLEDALRKQSKISHFDNKILVGTPTKIKAEWKQKITDQFGDLFLNDANYIVVAILKEGGNKQIKKFGDLISTVLDVDIAMSELKTIETDEDSEDQVVFIKITTK